MAHQTPRMLARTLKILRERKEFSLVQLAEKIGRSRAAIGAYETRDDGISYEILERYQLFFGAPCAIILAISHTAAMSRDASASADPEIRRREKIKLRVMARYLRNLSERILKPGQQRALWDYENIDAKEMETWNELLNDICRATQFGIGPTRNRVFEEHKRLANVVAKDRAAPRKGGKRRR